MVLTKKYWIKIQLILVFIYLALFPLGQIPRLLFQFYGLDVPIHLTDVIVVVSFITTLLYQPTHLLTSRLFRNIVVIFSFSFVVGIIHWGIDVSVNPGLLYLVRFFAYLSLFYTLSQLVIQKALSKNLIYDSLLLIGFVTSILGFVQYLFFYDLRSLYNIGWDDHLYRLTSTFLDPAFTGIILVFSALLALSLYIKSREKHYIVYFVVSVVAILLTYSRASYLAFLAGVLVLFFNQWRSKLRLLPYLAATAIIVLALLPKPAGEGVNLLRTNSIVLKLHNYAESLDIIKQYPLAGVGYNNICLLRDTQLRIETGSFVSHACSGLDNSFLFILATTGVVGLLVYLDFLAKLVLTVKTKLFFMTIVAVLIHTQFTNTLFYSWVLGWLALLFAAEFTLSRLDK